MCRQIALNMEGPNQFQKDWKIGRDAVVINLREQGSDSKNQETALFALKSKKMAISDSRLQTVDILEG